MAAVALTTLSLFAACGVRSEGDPTAVADDDVPFGLLTTSTTAPPPPTTIPAVTFPLTVCFHRGPEVLPVPRSAPERGVTAAIRALLDGPTAEEAEQGISSAVFDPAIVLSARATGGIATVELSPAFADVGTVVQLDVIVELVCTLTAQPGVGQVSFELRGLPVEVPRGDGSLTAEPVSRDDFPGVIVAGGP